jgi:hypothetical protein
MDKTFMHTWVKNHCKFAQTESAPISDNPFSEEDHARLGAIERQYEESLDSFEIIKEETEEIESTEEGIYMDGNVLMKSTFPAPPGLIQYHVWNYGNHTQYPSQELQDVVLKDIEGEYPQALQDWIGFQGWKERSVTYTPVSVNPTGNDQFDVIINANVTGLYIPESSHDEPDYGDPGRDPTDADYWRIGER